MSLSGNKENSDTLVVLIHGFCRSGADMQVWKDCMIKDFPAVLTPDLPTRYSSFELCVKTLEQEMDAASPQKYARVFFAGHSMGGLIARAYLKANPHIRAQKLVCAGTPHYGSKLADIALLFPGAGAIWKPLHALKCSARTSITTPDIPDLQIGAITSRNNDFLFGKLFLPSPADGFVELHSATPPDAAHITEVSASHVKMQYDPKTAALIKKFFLTGKF